MRVRAESVTVAATSAVPVEEMPRLFEVAKVVMAVPGVLSVVDAAAIVSEVVRPAARPPGGGCVRTTAGTTRGSSSSRRSSSGSKQRHCFQPAAEAPGGEQESIAGDVSCLLLVGGGWGRGGACRVARR